MAGYSNLIELLLADDYSVVAALHVVADVCEVEPLAKALLLIFSAEGKELQAAARLVKQEFALHQHHPAQILRQQSLASRVLGEHARASGRGFLEAALGPELRRLVGSTSSYDLEVDPSRLESDASSTHRLDENVRRLQQWGDAFVLALTSEGALGALPSSMRALAATIRAASAAHGLTPEQTTALVGGYLILRVVNPAIVTPEAHGLLGQRATATAELPLGSASISAHGVASAEFGPQGEGAIEGAYLDYQRERLDAHAAPSPYNRFESCSVEGGSVK